jgi:hypothetical protein
MPGPLDGLRVLELAHERTAFAGKLLADAGADVRLVEPRDGCAQRRHAPFVDDRPDPEGSLSFWHYNTSKRGITLDLDTPRGGEIARELIARVDVVPEGDLGGSRRSDSMHLPRSNGTASWWVSITPFAATRRAPPSPRPTRRRRRWRTGLELRLRRPRIATDPRRRNQAYHTGAHSR